MICNCIEKQTRKDEYSLLRNDNTVAVLLTDGEFGEASGLIVVMPLLKGRYVNFDMAQVGDNWDGMTLKWPPIAFIALTYYIFIALSCLAEAF